MRSKKGSEIGSYNEKLNVELRKGSNKRRIL